MDKLNELEILAKAVVKNIQCRRYPIQQFLDAATPESILAIAKAFRELEHRAAAAEAEVKHQLSVNTIVSRHHQEVIAQRDKALSQLSEIARQEPYGYVAESPCSSGYGGMMYEFSIDRRDAEHDAKQAEGSVIELFTRPAPAAVPVDLVPDEAKQSSSWNRASYPGAYDAGWNACRAEMLRRIEGLK